MTIGLALCFSWQRETNTMCKHTTTSGKNPHICHHVVSANLLQRAAALRGRSWTAWSRSACSGWPTPSWRLPFSQPSCSSRRGRSRTEGAGRREDWVRFCPWWRTDPLYQSSVYLGNAYPSQPKVQGPGIIAAQVLDVLRLFLDLWML